MKNKLIREYRDLCRSIGVEVLDYGVSGSGHVWLACRYGGKTRKIHLASSTSDWRAYQNMKSDIRRAFGMCSKEKAPQLQSGGAKWA